MSRHMVYLTDEQWRKIEPLIPKRSVGPKGGRPRTDDCLVFEGILWILRTGARWKDLPDRYPNPSTCWRRLKEWYEADVLKDMWRAFLSELDHEGSLTGKKHSWTAAAFLQKKGRRSRSEHRHRDVVDNEEEIICSKCESELIQQHGETLGGADKDDIF